MEFKKLSAVEAVEAISDTASILIEENGIIKRAPKDEIGGGIKVASAAEVGQTIVVKAVDADGMPTEWECANLSVESDMVIAIKDFFWNSPTSLTADRFSIESGGLEAVKNALISGNTPIVKVKYYCDDWNDGRSVAAGEFSCASSKYDESVSFYYINDLGRHRIFMYFNDSAYLSYSFTPWANVSGGTVF